LAGLTLAGLAVAGLAILADLSTARRSTSRPRVAERRRFHGSACPHRGSALAAPRFRLQRTERKGWR